jgi:hypothetical protein
VDAGDIARRFRKILDEAEAFVRAMPAGQEGVLFLREREPVQPDPANLAGTPNTLGGGAATGHPRRRLAAQCWAMAEYRKASNALTAEDRAVWWRARSDDVDRSFDAACPFVLTAPSGQQDW